MASSNRISRLLPVTILATGLGVSAAGVPAAPQNSPDPVRIEFDPYGRVTHVDPAFLTELGADPSNQTPKEWDRMTIPEPTPVPGNKINAMCVCRRPK